MFSVIEGGKPKQKPQPPEPGEGSLVMTKNQQDLLQGVVHLRKHLADFMEGHGLPIGVGFTEPYRTPAGLEIALQAIFPSIVIDQHFTFTPDCPKNKLSRNEYTKRILVTAIEKLREMADMLDEIVPKDEGSAPHAG